MASRRGRGRARLPGREEVSDAADLASGSAPHSARMQILAMGQGLQDAPGQCPTRGDRAPGGFAALVKGNPRWGSACSQSPVGTAAASFGSP